MKVRTQEEVEHTECAQERRAKEGCVRVCRGGGESDSEDSRKERAKVETRAVRVKTRGVIVKTARKSDSEAVSCFLAV